ncbi:hypothetical protein GCM10022393_02430 [Aquimarina addita]|uniref:DUF3471 domain-containing protein n=1 Tax=Aquimarina addita TaxID=870485 RepID=A0ABP7X8F3_9FLAO
MKLILTIFLTCFFVTSSFAQEEEVLNTIFDQVEIIDSFIESEEISLDAEEFLDHMVDHGAELIGYYEHERLKKIVKKMGMHNAMIITVYYFANDQLIYVNYRQKQYMEMKNDQGKVVMDYANSFMKFETKHYFNNGEEIKKEVTGSPVEGQKPEEEFVEYSMRIKPLLDNKFKNKNTYKALQGKWVNTQSTDEHMVFDETIRFNFRNGKFLKRLKVTIKDGTMYCSSPNDEYMYKYKIESINEYELVLKDLQNLSSDLSFYRKIE